MDPESSKPDSSHKNKRKKRKFRGVRYEYDDFEYEIDNDDYLAAKNVLISAGYSLEDEESANARIFNAGIFDIIGDKGNRLMKLEIELQGEPGERELSDEIGNLSAMTILWLYGLSIPPGAIARLENLKQLSISESFMKSLPTSILQLQHLKQLSITRAENLSKLPEEIGNLAGLTKLNLSRTGITSFPSSIKRLQDLKHLDLSFTSKLLSLPTEIGELSCLEFLDLGYSTISSLPPSIGRLEKLRCLNLRCTKQISNLPATIGDLSNLETLDLRCSGIITLPISFGNLAKLESIVLTESKLATLPESFGQLASLKTLYIDDTSLLRGLEENADDFLSSLAKRLPNLAYLSAGFDRIEGPKLDYVLRCNRNRDRLPFQRKNKDSIQIAKMWPHMLNNAINTLLRSPYHGKYVAQQPDCIYWLLQEGRESFLRVVMDRNAQMRK